VRQKTTVISGLGCKGLITRDRDTLSRSKCGEQSRPTAVSAAGTDRGDEATPERWIVKMAETPDKVEVYHVFLSSPGDMENEREAVRLFFDSLNQSIALPFGLRFDVIDWENCTNIGYENPQDLITEQTLTKFSSSLALVIGLMGQRFGTPTGRFESGTQAEFEWAAGYRQTHGHPEIKWFFRRIESFAAPAKNDRDIQEAVKQWKKVKRFRKDFKGYYREFASTLSFPDILREDLLRWFASWIARRRAIGVCDLQTTISESAEIPNFLDNRLSRTLRIVTALEDLVREVPQDGGLSIRTCAVMSSLAITEDNTWAQPGDEEYVQLIVRERNLIEQLFEQKTSLKVLLTWNVKEMLEWEKKSRDDVLSRLHRLKTFCVKTLEDDSKVRRAQLVHTAVRDRNVLILGKRYVFEGRKLSTQAGFEATQVIIDRKRVAQEIEMFDILFRNAVERERIALKVCDEANLNRKLLLSVIDRIDRDVRDLKAI
jgi:hypothetical protein